MAGLTVLDASVLIAHLDDRDAHHAEGTRLLTAVGAAGGEFAASSLTLAEALVAPARAGRLAPAEQALRLLGVIEIPLGHDSPVRLARLRAETERKLPDCCVLLAAEDAAAEAIATFDAALAQTVRDRGFEVAADPP